jgi:O-antigen ligase
MKFVLSRFRIARLYRGFVDLILLIAPIGLFYFSAARVLIWFFFVISLFSLYQSRLQPWLLRNAGLYSVALILGALVALHPDLAIDGVRRIMLGLCIFVPGLMIGRQLRERPLAVLSLLPVLALAIAQLFSPREYYGRFYLGFHDNPNSAGHGFAFALLILGVAYASVRDHRQAGWIGSKRWCYQCWWALTVAALAALLLISNYRAGWLGVFIFSLILVLWEANLPARVRFVMALLLCAGAAILVRFKDYKALGAGSSMEERLVLWGRALGAWQQHFPLFGSGFRSFEVMSDHYLGGIVKRVYRYPHNMIVEILFSSGIYGLVVTIVYVVVQGRGLLSAGLRFDLCLPKAALLAMVSMLAMGQFGIQFASFEYVGALSCLFGILAAQLPESGQIGAPRMSDSAGW